jgi:hypothetical protein
LISDMVALMSPITAGAMLNILICGVDKQVVLW